jgi:hypothetical protein
VAIETVDDIVEEIMDRLGIYGAHDHEAEETCKNKPCRCCASGALRHRLDAAYKIERKLSE